MVPVEDLLEEVAHALVFAAAGEELAEFTEDEFQGLGVGAGALGGGLVGVDGLVGDGFLFLLELRLDLDELGLLGGLGVEADVDVGGLDLLVELIGEGDVGVAWRPPIWSRPACAVPPRASALPCAKTARKTFISVITNSTTPGMAIAF
jgi:hypothetical protein